MDRESAKIIRRVWKHSGVEGYVWLPTIQNMGKSTQRFNNGQPRLIDDKLPGLKPEIDSYWTPAVRSHLKSPNGKPRDATGYGPQKVLWVDCDDSYNDELLTKLRPSFVWETSPGHKQAIWLMSEPIDPAEFHKDGYMGMLTAALGGDPSGVDVPQLLRIPGSWHNKRGNHHGTILKSSGLVYTKGQLLTRVAKGLGLSPGVASELGADDPYGDRSLRIWKFAREASEAGISEELAFKLVNSCKWNKWKHEPEKLRSDIAKAYSSESSQKPKPKAAQHEADEEEPEEIQPWDLSTVGDFGPITREPLKWVLPGIIPEAGCGLIVAAPKVGKTRIAIEIALGIASGESPLGLDVKKPKAVGFFSLEDGEYLFAERLGKGMRENRRKYHWDGSVAVDGHTLTWEAPQPLALMTGFKRIDLSTDEDKQRLLETIEKYGLELVIIDTLSMAIGNSNVSDSKEMNGILADVREIAKATRCAIMFIHHTRKRMFEKGETIQESILGSTALHAWTEFVMNVIAPNEDEPMLRLAVQTKRGGGVKLVHPTDLKIIKRAEESPEEVAA